MTTSLVVIAIEKICGFRFNQKEGAFELKYTWVVKDHGLTSLGQAVASKAEDWVAICSTENLLKLSIPDNVASNDPLAVHVYEGVKSPFECVIDCCPDCGEMIVYESFQVTFFQNGETVPSHTIPTPHRFHPSISDLFIIHDCSSFTTKIGDLTIMSSALIRIPTS